VSRIGTQPPPGSMLDDATRDVLTAALQRWQVAAMLADVAAMTGAEASPDDLWDLLHSGTVIVTAVTRKRWQAVALLLRAGELESWAQLGDVLGLSAVGARDWFLGYLRSAAEWFDCHPQAPYGGLSRADVCELYPIVEGIEL
jgi:hypothetical protein